MLKRIFIFSILILIVFLSIYAKSKQDFCEKWNKLLDTTTNVDLKIRYSKQIVSKADPLCKVRIYAKIGAFYHQKQKLDSVVHFYTKAIKLGEHIKIKEEELWSMYANKSFFLVKNNNQKEALILLQNVKRLIKNDINNNAWLDYYASHELIAEKNKDYYKAIAYSDSTIQLKRRINDTTSLPTNYNNIGSYYYLSSNYEEAIKNILYATELREKQDNPKGLETNYHNLGLFYVEWGQYETGKKFIKKSISRAKEVRNHHGLMLAYSTLARCYRKLQENDNAIKTVDSILVLAKNQKDDITVAGALREKGWVYLNNIKQYDTAEKYFIKSHEIIKLSNNNNNLHQSFKALTEVYIKKKSYKKAGKYLKLLEYITKRMTPLINQQELHKRYSEYYEEIGQPSLAIDHLKKYYTIKDAIANEKVKTQVAHLEKKYDTKKKELKIVTLNKEKEKQKKIAIQAKSRQNLYLLATFFLLSLLITGIWAFRKLRKQQKELVSINQVKNRLFSIIAHDLRGMIIPFQRSGKILKYHIDKENFHRTIEISQELEKNSENLSYMLDNLLNWSLEQMNGYKINPEKISIKNQFRELIASFEQQTIYKKTKINLKYKEDILIEFDKGAFNVIFRNLISNALKYTENGTITIEFKKELNSFICSIIDTGIGMSEKQLQQLFTIEKEQSTIGTQGEKGTGIGLNLVYRFVKMHNGKITVSSKKEIGTQFELNIPILQSLKIKEENVSKFFST
ncbi:ATP-binding protein [Aquimarina longa]|uniref:ATP-binding protein n=1 Tax=Aquimarina longa TaxID=1080221 RepID=UPI0007814CE6|nr:ATP-binding protein [Aquimarina longa]